MAPTTKTWGCCKEEKDDDFSLSCSKCSKMFHCTCVGLDNRIFTPKETACWKCPVCLNMLPEGHKNVSIFRGSKKQAVNPSQQVQIETSLTREDVGEIVESVMSIQFSELLSKVNTSIVSALNSKFKPIQDEIGEMMKAMDHMNEQFEYMRQEHKTTQENIKTLKDENDKLRTTVIDLSGRVNLLEQHARAKNIELQCIPEKQQENVINIVKDLGQAIKCVIDEKHIINCTRVAKLQRDSNRPRSIIVEFVSPRLRDEFIAAAINYNKTNPTNKLNSSILGISGPKSQIYVSEHLSPANKALHAASRIKAKQMNYKFVWVKNGRIFVRKNDASSYIWIKDNNALDKMV